MSGLLGKRATEWSGECEWRGVRGLLGERVLGRGLEGFSAVCHTGHLKDASGWCRSYFLRWAASAGVGGGGGRLPGWGRTRPQVSGRHDTYQASVERLHNQRGATRHMLVGFLGLVSHRGLMITGRREEKMDLAILIQISLSTLMRTHSWYTTLSTRTSQF